MQRCNGSSQVGQRCALDVLLGTTRCKYHQRQWCCSVRWCDNGVSERRRNGKTYYRSEVCWKHGQGVDSDGDCDSDAGSFVEEMKNIMNPHDERSDDVRRECFKEMVYTTSEEPDDVVNGNTHRKRTPESAMLRDAKKTPEMTLVDFSLILSFPNDADSVC